MVLIIAQQLRHISKKVTKESYIGTDIKKKANAKTPLTVPKGGIT